MSTACCWRRHARRRDAVLAGDVDHEANKITDIKAVVDDLGQTVPHELVQIGRHDIGADEVLFEVLDRVSLRDVVEQEGSNSVLDPVVAEVLLRYGAARDHFENWMICILHGKSGAIVCGELIANRVVGRAVGPGGREFVLRIALSHRGLR